jgi:predicted transcriptional regulator
MSAANRAAAIVTLETAQSHLHELARTTQTQITLVANTFKGLAGHADTISGLAAGIVARVETDNISTVLTSVQTLSTVARRFIAERLQATTGLLETVATEVTLLKQLNSVTGAHSVIALKTKALSVLTNIEVARLGAVGAGFNYLAHELADFSDSLTRDTQELANHTDGDRVEVAHTKQVLSAELPRLREKLTFAEVALGGDLTALNTSLAQLSAEPEALRRSLQEIGQQIAGVVAAVQAHDITRQQLEHVHQALEGISKKLPHDGEPDDRVAQEAPRVYAGLLIQTYQLKNIKETVTHWTSQINTCMAGILRVSASELVGIGPLVLEQEREVSSHLAHIELLERQSQAYSEKIRAALAGLSTLAQLVSEHLQKTKSVRNRLRLLSFNSVIEASRLGAKAHAILSIARIIQEISAEWSEISDRSEHTMQGIFDLVTRTNQVMEAFSESSSEKLHEAQAHTRAGLENLRSAAAFAAAHSLQMKDVTDTMQVETAAVGKTGGLFDASFALLDEVMASVQELTSQFESDYPGISRRFDAAEVGEFFAASYTTEVERDVLHAALRGTAMPVAQQSFAGNTVELF